MENNSVRIGITGSRNWTDEARVRLVLSHWHKLFIGKIVIVTGGAKGPDSFAENWAKDNNVPTIIHIPKWYSPDGTFNPAAGYARNTLVVRDSDMIIAFWDGKSKGTKDTINKAKAVSKKVEVVSP